MALHNDVDPNVAARTCKDVGSESVQLANTAGGLLGGVGRGNPDKFDDCASHIINGIEELPSLLRVPSFDLVLVQILFVSMRAVVVQLQFYQFLLQVADHSKTLKTSPHDDVMPV